MELAFTCKLYMQQVQKSEVNNFSASAASSRISARLKQVAIYVLHSPHAIEPLAVDPASLTPTTRSSASNTSES